MRWSSESTPVWYDATSSSAVSRNAVWTASDVRTAERGLTAMRTASATIRNAREMNQAMPMSTLGTSRLPHDN